MDVLLAHVRQLERGSNHVCIIVAAEVEPKRGGAELNLLEIYNDTQGKCTHLDLRRLSLASGSCVTLVLGDIAPW